MWSSSQRKSFADDDVWGLVGLLERGIPHYFESKLCKEHVLADKAEREKISAGRREI